MKCPWITETKIFKYKDLSLPNGYGVKKESTFGDCIKEYCPFYIMKTCQRIYKEIFKK